MNIKSYLLLFSLASTDGELERLSKVAKPYKHDTHYQHSQWNPGTRPTPGIYNVSFQPGPFHLHPRTNTHEFPWVHTAGYKDAVPRYYYIPGTIKYTDTTGSRTIKTASGQSIPEHGDTERIIEWKYPVGTAFMEVLTTQEYPFEVRTRTKTTTGWRSNVYRPYQDVDDLVQRLRQLGTRDSKRLASSLGNLERTAVRIEDPHTVKSFRFDGYKETLPEIPEGLARTILSWKFVPYAGWKEDCFAPTTRSTKLSIVSRDYEGFMVKPDSKGCLQCHDSTLKHAFTLEGNRDWYGRVRGSDGIFSFSIFDPDSVSPSFDNRREIKLRTDFPLEHIRE